MKGTVNGKSLDQVLSELKAPFPEEELKKNEKNETYIPVESLESRLNSVIGVLNYDTLVTYEGIQEVLGRFVVVAKTILIIYDDERNALIRKSALGGSNIIVVKDTGKPSSLKTDIAAAQSESFKNVSPHDELPCILLSEVFYTHRAKIARGSFLLQCFCAILRVVPQPKPLQRRFGIWVL